MTHANRTAHILRCSITTIYLSFITLAILLILIATNGLGINRTRLSGEQRRNIGIFMAIDNLTSLPAYRTAVDSMTCYAQISGYSLDIVDLKDSKYDKRCPHKDLMFKRHCAAVEYLSKYDWMLFIDADIGVINPFHRIETWIDDNVSIIFYDRFFNWEVTAGTYLVKNSEYGKNFLNTWANYEYKLPKSFHGTDNGAIHAVLLEELVPFVDVEKSELCHKLWNQSHSFSDLFLFEACIRFLLGGQRVWPEKVKLLAKGKGWARDGWLTGTKWSCSDFMLHGWQERRLNRNVFAPWKMPFKKPFNMSRCSQDDYSNWNWLPEYRVSNADIAQILKNTAKGVEKQFWSKTILIGNAL